MRQPHTHTISMVRMSKRITCSATFWHCAPRQPKSTPHSPASSFQLKPKSRMHPTYVWLWLIWSLLKEMSLRSISWSTAPPSFRFRKFGIFFKSDQAQQLRLLFACQPSSTTIWCLIWLYLYKYICLVCVYFYLEFIYWRSKREQFVLYHKQQKK